MTKKGVIIVQCVLLTWFFLDMTGFSFGNNTLVTSTYKEDGIFFILYTLCIALFIFFEKIGQWVISIWLILWLVVQILSHELCFLLDVNPARKIAYYKNTLKLIQLDNIYLPDLYHIILRVLIVIALMTMRRYIKSQRHDKNGLEKTKHCLK